MVRGHRRVKAPVGIRGTTGNPVRIRDCPAAVIGNDRHHLANTWRGQALDAAASGKRWPVGHRRTRRSGLRRRRPKVRRPAIAAWATGPRRSGPRGTVARDRASPGSCRWLRTRRRSARQGAQMNRPRPPHRRIAARRPIALITTIIAVAALLAGCGNSSDSAGASTSAASGSSGAAPSAADNGSATSTPASELNAAAGLDAKGCITDFDPAADYYPVKSQIDYATNFTVEYEKSYQVLTVLQPTQGGSPESYVLVKCGAPVS